MDSIPRPKVEPLSPSLLGGTFPLEREVVGRGRVHARDCPVRQRNSGCFHLVAHYKMMLKKTSLIPAKNNLLGLEDDQKAIHIMTDFSSQDTEQILMPLNHNYSAFAKREKQKISVNITMDLPVQSGLRSFNVV